MHVKSLNIVTNNFERSLFSFIFWSLGFLTLVYVLLLGNMVKNIVERQSLESSARTLVNEVRDLEVTYLSMSNKVDLTLSYSLGFKNTQATFATRKTLGLLSPGESFDRAKIVQNDL